MKFPKSTITIFILFFLFSKCFSQTVLLEADLNTWSESSNPKILFSIQNKLFFEASNQYKCIWSYDGQSTPLVGSLSNFGITINNENDYQVFKDKLYFKKEHYSKGVELFVYDGIKSPEIVDDLIPGFYSSNPSHFTVLNDRLFFRANSTESYTLWFYDGQNIPVKVNEGLDPLRITTFNDKLYFYSSKHARVSASFWCYNQDSLHIIKEFAGSYFNESDIPAPATLNDNLFMISRDTIFVVDFENNIHKASELFPGYWGNSPSVLMEYNNQLFFNAKNEAGQRVWWMFDGENEPILFDNMPENWHSIYKSGNFLNYKDKIYFGNTKTETGNEVWEWDGENSKLLFDIYPGTTSSEPKEFMIYNNTLYFAANDKKHGREVWKYDGTNNPKLAFDLNKNSSSNINYITTLNNDLYFVANDTIKEKQLWQYNRKQPPVKLSTIYPDFNVNAPKNLFSFNNQLYFSASTEETGEELWAYDGESIPHLISDLNPGTEDSSPENFIAFNNNLIFSTSTYDGKAKIWSYDGYNPPLELTENISTDTIIIAVKNITEFQNKLFFLIDYNENNLNHYCLWELDMDYNFYEIYDTCPNNPNVYFITNFNLFEEFNNTLYFNCYKQLMSYDGTNNPSKFYIQNSNWVPGYVSCAISNDNEIYFVENRDIWMYNSSGILSKLGNYLGLGDSPNEFFIYRNQLHYSATNNNHGQELWRYDGESEPELLVDINKVCFFESATQSVSFGSYPKNFYDLNDTLYLVANDGIHGSELMRYSDEIPTSNNTNRINTLKNSRFNIYPNPTNDKITIQLDNYYKDINLTIFDITGNLLFKKTFNSTNQITNNFNVHPGTYIFQLKTLDGYIERKIIIKQ